MIAIDWTIIGMLISLIGGLVVGVRLTTQHGYPTNYMPPNPYEPYGE